MTSTKTASNTTAPTQFLQANGHSYEYRRFGNGSGLGTRLEVDLKAA